MTHPVLAARALGQSFWYDSLSRDLISSGQLRRLIERDGIRGVTSNPSIFEKAMVGTPDYASSLRALIDRGVRQPKALYEQLAIEDIRAAADLLSPYYRESGRTDGYVSLEVSPHLAHDTDGTIKEARRLFAEASRSNVMIKVPGTRAGMPAIEQLIAEGVNVNVTLLFGLGAYRACAEAYLRGLERLVAGGGDPAAVAGVASFFLSRIDALVDDRLAALLVRPASAGGRLKIAALLGKVAIANAKLAYAHFQELQHGARWKTLAARGAHPQRLLWASTGTKNQAYPKTMYIDPLIGPDTVNTVPAETLHAFLTQPQGTPHATVTEGVRHAREVLDGLEAAGISLDEVTDILLRKGVETFATSFDKLLAALEKSVAKAVPDDRCMMCGAFTSLSFGGQTVCESCYEARGSCCTEFSGDEL